MTLTDATMSIKQARQALVLQQRETQRQLDRLAKAIDALDSVLEDGTPHTRVEAVTVPHQKRQRRSVVKSAIVAILQEEPRAVLHVDDVVRALQQRNVRMAGRNPKATVGPTLARMATEGLAERVGPSQYRASGTVTAESVTPDDLMMVTTGEEHGDGSDDSEVSLAETLSLIDDHEAALV